MRQFKNLSPLFCTGLGAALLTIASSSSVQAQKFAHDIQELTRRIDALQITSGALAGAYKTNCDAAGVNWYFNNLGLLAVALEGGHDNEVRQYLDLYLAKATQPGNAINDYSDYRSVPPEEQTADSDDSYASTLLSLACFYAKQSSTGQVWFAANKTRLKTIADHNLAGVINPHLFLTTTFNSAPGRTQSLSAAQRPYQSIMLFMDNCQSYRGLKDFGDYLASINDGSAETYLDSARILAQGLKAQFDPALNAFQWRAGVPPGDAGQEKFYPGRLCQIFPQIYGVDFGPETEALYSAGWSYLNARGDRWWKGQILEDSISIQPDLNFPWMILGYAATLRGENGKAGDHLNYFMQTLPTATSTRAPFGSIDELGWALRIARFLQGTAF